MSGDFKTAAKTAVMFSVILLAGRLLTQLTFDTPIDVGLETVTFVLFVAVVTVVKMKMRLLG